MILEIGRNKRFTLSGKQGFLMGFTLVEVIIIIGVLSFGLILILQDFAHSFNTISISHNNLQANLSADKLTA